MKKKDRKLTISLKNGCVPIFFIAGTLTSTGLRRDVQKEIALYTDVTDEGSSHYIQHNLKRCRNPALCRKLQEEKDEDFRVNCFGMQKGCFAKRILQAQTNNKGFLFILFVTLRPR